MMRWRRWLGYGAGGLAGVLIVAASAVYAMSESKLGSVAGHAERLATPTPAEIADAPRQARIFGCIDCHGEGLAGKPFLDDPKLARIWAPNLTRVAAGATDQQIARAIRQGIGSDGRALFIMSSPQYAVLGDGEVAALIGFIRRQPLTGEPSPPRRIGPVGRVGIALGKFQSAPDRVAEYATREPVRLDPATESGRRIAMRSCTDCHGPDLGGGASDPDEPAPDLDIAAAYDLAGFTKLLRTGVPAPGRHVRMMGGTARSSLRYLTDGEIGQVHAYLVARASR